MPSTTIEVMILVSCAWLIRLRERSIRPSLCGTDDLQRQCAVCHLLHPAEAFSRKQLRKGMTRRCASCVARSHDPKQDRGATVSLAKRRGTARSAAIKSTTPTFDVERLLASVAQKTFNLSTLITVVKDAGKHRRHIPNAWKQVMLATLLPEWTAAVLAYVEAQTQITGIGGQLDMLFALPAPCQSNSYHTCFRLQPSCVLPALRSPPH
jgi:hypothetical protein